MKLSVINGPNLNMLGIREPKVYGKETYADLCEMIQTTCNKESIEVIFYQSNHEGSLVDEIQSLLGKVDGIIINPAAYTHTSIAILDALKTVAIPTVEVHISDITKRESFRQHSFISEYCLQTIAGKGLQGYIDAVYILKQYIEQGETI